MAKKVVAGSNAKAKPAVRPAAKVAKAVSPKPRTGRR